MKLILTGKHSLQASNRDFLTLAVPAILSCRDASPIDTDLHGVYS